MSEMLAWLRAQIEVTRAADAARADAESAILDRVVPHLRDDEVQLADEFGGGWPGDEPTPNEDLLVRLLAYGYRNRDGYHVEWKPEPAEA